MMIRQMVICTIDHTDGGNLLKVQTEHTLYLLGIFSKTEQYFLLLDKLSPDSVMASSRSEESVVLNNFQHKRCISLGIPL